MIRQAQPADAAAVGEIWNEIIRNTAATFASAEKSEAEIAALITGRQAAGRGFWVAEDAAGLLGFATYDQFRGGNGYRRSMEHTIQLHDRARGRGFGRALMTRLEDHARQAGGHVMMAGVSAENPAGRDFHLAIGYKLIATLPEVGHKFDRYMDLWLMQKILT